MSRLSTLSTTIVTLLENITEQHLLRGTRAKDISLNDPLYTTPSELQICGLVHLSAKMHHNNVLFPTPQILKCAFAQN